MPSAASHAGNVWAACCGTTTTAKRLERSTDESFEHRCQRAEPCAGISAALADRAPPGWHRLLGIAPSAEIGAFCRIQTPIAKAFPLG
ncbi:MAG: hypothetical protein ACLQNE_42095 [Thermoguttaceae bacterium]